MRIRILITALASLAIGISAALLVKRDPEMRTAMLRATYVHQTGRWPAIQLPPCDDGYSTARCKQI